MQSDDHVASEVPTLPHRLLVMYGCSKPFVQAMQRLMWLEGELLAHRITARGAWGSVVRLSEGELLAHRIFYQGISSVSRPEDVTYHDQAWSRYDLHRILSAETMHF